MPQIVYQLEDLRRLNGLDDRVMQVGKGELDQLATDITDIAKSLAPVRQGYLKNSIHKEEGAESDSFYSVKVVAGDGIVNYAPYVEAKQPFMTPAVQIATAGFAEKLKNAVEVVLTP